MALTKPVLYNLAAFDADNKQVFRFYTQGGSQVVANKLTIKNNSTLAQVYQDTETTFAYAHTVPAETLTNGAKYQAVIQTIDSDGNISVESDPILFYCYTTPTMEFTNMPPQNNILNASFSFDVKYNQLEGEVLASYSYSLYDIAGDLLATSGVKYNTDTTVPLGLTYLFGWLEDKATYQIECIGQTAEGTSVSTGKTTIYIIYEIPRLYSTMFLYNNCAEGYITVENNIIGIPGKSNPSPPTYIDDEEVNLRSDGSWVKWDDGYEINGDYTMRIWGRDFNPNSNILTFTSTSGAKIIISYHVEGELAWFQLLAIHKNWKYGYIIKSNTIPIPANTEYLMIWNRRVNNVYDLIIENRGETV